MSDPRTFGEKILKFYQSIKLPQAKLSAEVMLPFETREVVEINRQFYDKYYNDHSDRVFLIGINPGRFGGGVTGIPFTDPLNLDLELGIKNTFTAKHELSSQFIYAVIKELGGPESFFSRYYLTAVSPVGFLLNNKNINYYELSDLVPEWESFFVNSLAAQISIGARRDTAFSLGQGKNFGYLKKLNSREHWFDRVVELPHPRWIMQYHYKDRKKFVRKYVRTLAQAWT